MTKIKNILNISKKVMLSRSDRKTYRVYMEAIDNNIEKKFDEQIEKKGSYKYTTCDGITIHSDDVLLYGEINLNNKNDIKLLDKFKDYLLNSWDESNFLYSNFNYNTGKIAFNENRNAYIGTNFVANHIAWFKQMYCMLGKPDKIIIYKQRML